LTVDSQGRVRFSPPPESICALAKQLRVHVAELLKQLGDSPTIAQVNLAKAVLADTYMSYRKRADGDHRSYMGCEHVCIFQLWEEGHEKLEQLRVKADLLQLVPKRASQLPSLSLPQDFSLAVSPNEIISSGQRFEEEED
jgi:hypothetical protein